MRRTTCRNRLVWQGHRARFIFVAAICLGLLVTSARGGSLDDPGAPTDPASAMYTAQDLYNRLAFGTNAPKRAGAFTEPTAGPTNVTMYSTDEIMAKAPATNVSGAVDGEVLSGKTFWGLTQGAWGTRTGTIATVTLSPAHDTVSNGYYAATTLHAVDADLAAGNIASNIAIFGVTGTAIEATGDAVVADVLATKTFSKSGASGLTGTMTNQAARGFMPGTANVPIPAGYYSGSGVVTGDGALVTGNIKAGTTIFGVAGSNAVVDTTVATATTNDLLSGKTAWVQGAAITGTIETVTLSGATTVMAAGNYAATNLAQVATNLAAGNIKTNENIFGVVGTYEVGGGSVTNAPVPKTGQTNSYADYDDGWYSTNVGVALPNPRFTVVGAADTAETNQIRDNLTGLIWARNANFAGGQKTWQNALNYIAATNASLTLYGGTNDWRLPNVRELFSLIHLGYYSPALCDTEGTAQWEDGNPFTGVQSDIGSGSSEYWASSTYTPNSSASWFVRLGDGEVSRTSINEWYFVWPVRGP